MTVGPTSIPIQGAQLTPHEPSRSDSAASGGVPASEFRATAAGLAMAVSVIATRGPAGIAGLTCSAVCVVSDAPPTIVACVNRRSAASDVIKANRVLCVNCLPVERRDLSQLFAGVDQVPMAERFTRGNWAELKTGSPHCPDALAAFDCELMEVHEVGTHSIFVGRVLATAQGATAEPLVYHRRQYATTRSI
jgi:flavin reductase (DIM6/NTAB) family NADH-FMN oxidoreductase RutF